MTVIVPKGTLVGLGSDLILNDDGSIEWTSKDDVDSDGTGLHYGDRTAQNETSYKPNLNADVDKFIVVPPLIIDSVAGIVMGCQAHAKYFATGKESDAVVGDQGPHHKIGEGSRALAIALGVPPSPVSGGDQSTNAVHFKIWPGVAANVDGKQYSLQPA